MTQTSRHGAMFGPMKIIVKIIIRYVIMCADFTCGSNRRQKTYNTCWSVTTKQHTKMCIHLKANIDRNMKPESYFGAVKKRMPPDIKSTVPEADWVMLY